MAKAAESNRISDSGPLLQVENLKKYFPMIFDDFCLIFDDFHTVLKFHTHFIGFP